MVRKANEDIHSLSSLTDEPENVCFSSLYAFSLERLCKSVQPMNRSTDQDHFDSGLFRLISFDRSEQMVPTFLK